MTTDYNSIPHGRLAKTVKTADRFAETVDMVSERLDYYEYECQNAKPGEWSKIHWGQRKLMLSLMEFLTQCEHLISDGAICLYIGAAKGTNIKLVADIFSGVEFHLYDPAKFDPILRECKNVHIHNELFLEETIAKWNQERIKPMLFISDIRTVPDEEDSFKRREKYVKSECGMVMKKKDGKGKSNTKEMLSHVEDNMALQKSIVLSLRPDAFQVKFRLPWNYKKGDSYSYLGGRAYIQCYPPMMSTETRLTGFTEDIAEKKWDIWDYDSVMCYHNAIARTDYYPGLVRHESATEADEYCHCYDCFREYHILLRFSKMNEVINFFGLRGRNNVDIVKYLSLKISTFLDIEKAQLLRVAWYHST